MDKTRLPFIIREQSRILPSWKCGGLYIRMGEKHMIFNSMLFLGAFLPVIFILDKITGRSRALQNLLLLAASLFFYAWGQPEYLWLLLASVLVNYLAGLAMGQSRRKPGSGTEAGTRGTGSSGHMALVVLVLGILVNLGLLGYYKYFNFFANTLNRVLGSEILPMQEIALPLGISFFTFQAITYLVDLYREKVPAEKNILHLALYFSFFPRITQGPIEKYRDFAPQVAGRKQSVQKMGEGVRRFIYGLAKKVVIADTLGTCVDQIYGLELSNVSGALAWIAAVFYSLQLYYDFSGYSDMAVGLGKMFGFDLAENFHYPYMAVSIADFWRRWHMSLTSWFREYLYFPLGGSRKGRLRTCGNIFVVFMATGLWHGASWDFIIWGLYHGVFQVLERLGLNRILGKSRILSHIYTLLVVGVGWVFFRAGDMGVALSYVKRMFLPWMYTASDYTVRELVPNRAFAAAFLGILGCGLIQMIGERLAGRDRHSGSETEARSAFFPSFRYSTAELVFCMLLLAYSILLMVSSTYSAFLYMNF